jgi:GNAT superfamily N-acetyltransferase
MEGSGDEDVAGIAASRTAWTDDTPTVCEHHGMSPETPPIEIRRAVPGDERDLATIHVAAWSDAYRGLLPDDVIDGQTVDRRIRQWERTLGSGSIASWIATVGGRPAGLISVGGTAQGDIGEVLTLHVTRPYWDLGVGSRLLEAGAAHLEALGFASAGLWVIDTSARGRRFLEHKGWSLNGDTRMDDTFGRAISEVRYVSRMWVSPGV